jgi:DHA1 family tetracycline resistance protein-like MFS transporter
VVKRLGERKALITGLMFGIAGFTIYGAASVPELVWLAIPVMSLWAFYGPSVQGLMSKRVSPSEQGQLQGANASMMGIASLFTPTLYTQVFAYSIDPEVGLNMPGAPFYLAAVMLVIALAISMRVARPVPAASVQPAGGG